MKPFVIKITLFVLGLCLLFPIKTVYLLKNNRYKKLVLGAEVYLSQDKSKRRNKKAKTLIIGDSVGQQLFKNSVYNDTLYSLACNQAISLAGHYFLLEDFLKLNPEVEKVIFIYAPRTFKNNLDQQYTFQYFLKPFYNEEYKSRFSATMMVQVKKVPLYYLSQFGPVLTSNWSPDLDFPKEESNYYMSSISDEYLTKIINLCHEHSLKFILLPTPTRQSFVEKVSEFSSHLTYTGYNFKDYFSRIDYIPDSCFLDDVHLKEPLKFQGAYFKAMSEL